MEFTVSNRAKITTYVLMVIGVVAMVMGWMDHGPEGEHTNRFWANMLVNGFFFTAIGLGALFFLALQYAAEVAWSVAVKRILEGIAAFVPVGAIILIVVFLANSLHMSHLYHWMDPNVHIEGHEDYDAIIANKKPYLTQWFFWLRTLVYFAVFIWFGRYFRKKSLEEDQMGGDNIFKKNMGMAAIFLVLFAVFSSTLSWDWIMSIDTHWFSTLFGWYVFSGMWVTAMIVAVLLVIYLKSKGLLEQVNENHIHDLGKWMFAISFLWTYLWFSQFMLIWYSNIPEEVTYYIQRIEQYKLPFFGMFFVNFIFPMIILMSRDTKRNILYLVPVALIIFAGHWMDVFVMVMPATVHEHWHLGFVEIGMFLGFLGLFVNVVFRALSKAPLMVKSHPYLDESLHHQV